MHQKYVISLDETKHSLKIREYAVTDKNLKKAATPINSKASFTFLCEETYQSEIIENSISEGMTALVASLRTHNLFPIEPNVAKIAESVIALYNAPEDNPVELFFNDTELLNV